MALCLLHLMTLAYASLIDSMVLCLPHRMTLANLSLIEYRALGFPPCISLAYASLTDSLAICHLHRMTLATASLMGSAGLLSSPSNAVSITDGLFFLVSSTPLPNASLIDYRALDAPPVYR